jgi:hypothetical protein
MSPPERFTRRRLLSLLRGPDPKPERSFSLVAFYGARADEPRETRSPPVFQHRHGLEFTAATRVGVPELAAAPGRSTQAAVSRPTAGTPPKPSERP